MMIIRHPRAEEGMERIVSHTPEAGELQNAICMAMSAYEDYLERANLIGDPEDGKAWGLTIVQTFGHSWEFFLERSHDCRVTR
jgi:hypothetical protein